MKCKIIILFFLLFFGVHVNSFCQTEEISIPFFSYWSKGDTYDFRVTKIKKQWTGDRLSKNDSSQYIMRFEVIDSTESSYKIKWSYRNNLFNTYQLPESLREKLSKYSVTEVIYTTNELGEFTGIENWEEIGRMMTDIFTHMLNSSDESSVDKREALKKAMQPIISVYTTKEGIEQIAFPELLYFHFPFGVEISTGEPIEYEDQLPNMFGGSPIKADSKIYFESVDVDNYHCAFIHERKMNPDDAKQIVVDLFKKMGLKNNKIKRAIKTAKLDIIDHNRYEYYYNPGIPMLINTQREAIVDLGAEKVRRIDKTTIELLN